MRWHWTEFARLRRSETRDRPILSAAFHELTIGSRIPPRVAGVLGLLGIAVEVAIGWRVGPTAVLPVCLVLGAVGLWIAAIDVVDRRIPNAIVIPTWLVTFAWIVIAAAAQDRWFGVVRGAVGMLALGGLYLILALWRPGELGLGDVKLALWLGLALARLGWRALVVGAFAGPALAAIVAIVLIAVHRERGRATFPFGPFLVLGALVAIFVQ